MLIHTFVKQYKHSYICKEFAILPANNPHKFWNFLNRKFRLNNIQQKTNEMIFDDLEKAIKLNGYFSSVYERDDGINVYA